MDVINLTKILLIIILCLSLVGCTSATETSNKNNIEFSLTRDKETKELGIRVNVFKWEENTENIFYYTSPLSGNTAKYEIIFEKDNIIYSDDKEDINISPDWTGITAAYKIPYDEGKYTMKIFNIKEEKLVGIGEFEVTK